MKWLTSAAIVVLALAALSCSQQSGTPAASAQSAEQAAVPDTAAALPDSAAAAHLKALEAGVTAIFETSCTGCHNGEPKPGKLSLESAAFVETMVGMPCAQIDTLKLVEPGRPDRSYLIMKVAGDPRIKGKRMPKGEDPLPAEQIKVLTDWVVALAPAPAVSSAPASRMGS